MRVACVVLITLTQELMLLPYTIASAEHVQLTAHPPRRNAQNFDETRARAGCCANAQMSL